MTAPHFFIDSLHGDAVRLDPDDAHHAAAVLRIEVGETITVADGRGAVAAAIVTRSDAGGKRAPAAVHATIVERRTLERARPRLVVYPAVPKGGKLDLVVQKLAEIGVASVRPWFAARSVARWDERKAAAQTQRLGAIAREAAKQSRSPWLLEVRPPAPPSDMPDPTVVLHEEEQTRLSGVLPERAPEEIGLVIGPEGGLGLDEVATLEVAGARRAGLGPQVLRTETAAIVACVLIYGRYGILG